MKHKKNLKSFFLMAVCLAIIGSCKDDAINEHYFNRKPSSGQLEEMKHYFETTAPTLRQVSFDTPHADHTTRQSPSPQKIADLSPDWDKAYVWDAYKNIYIEVPLKGEGLYSRALFKSGGAMYSYPTRSFLVLVKDKASGTINYHVVTTILERIGHNKPDEEQFRYVGNAELNGFLLFSKVDGTLLKTLHLRNGKSRLLHLGNLMADTRSANVGSLSEESCTLSLVSSTSAYIFKESCDPSCNGCCSECQVVCAICSQPYCIDKGECPNGCGCEVPGDKWKICSVCGADYDVTLFSSCPNCPPSFPCPICNRDPCKCIERCERCGSVACPGSWYCSREEECTGMRCLICGGYKSNTRSSSSCPPCTCREEPTPDPDEVDKIIINEHSFGADETGMARCILEKLLNDINFKNIIHKFDGSFTFADLMFSLSYSLENNTGAITHQPYWYMMEIELNGNLLNRPNLSIVAAYAHEIFHAEMFRVLLTLGNLNGKIDVPKLEKSLATHNYPVIFDYYCQYGKNFQHELMANTYVSSITSILKAFDPSQPDYIYESLAWEGLHETAAWNNLSEEKVQSIKDYVINFNEEGAEECR